MNRCIFLWIIFSLAFGKDIYAQIIAPDLVGRWQAVSEYNADSTYFSPINKAHKYIYHFDANGNFKYYHTVISSNSTSTYKTAGRWKFSEESNELLLFDRAPLPSRPNMKYADSKYRVVKLTGHDLSLYGNFSIQSEGGLGTWNFRKLNK